MSHHSTVVTTDTVIKFYESKSDYYEFSNFYKAPITFSLHPNEKPLVFPTSEHAYQAAKFDDAEYIEIIRKAKTPNQARIYGLQKTGGGYKWRTDMNPTIRSYQHVKMRADWNDVRDDVMQKIVDAKFSQNPALKKRLLDTGERRIIEDSKDVHWGMKNGKGDNALGLILERARKRFRAV